MKASDYIVQFLKHKGIDVVFGYSGGAITHLMDSLNQEDGIRFLQTYHEQTASIAAEGFSWLSGVPGVAMATSGPGATNLLTGIADAYFDSLPVIYITGQVNTYEYKGDKPIRQQGFQETDIVAIVESVTKYAVQVTDPDHLRYELEKAWTAATTGRQGPVLLDIPMDVQRADIDGQSMKPYPTKSVETRRLKYLNGFSMEKLAALVAGSRRPLLLLGGGVARAGAAEEARKLARLHGIPVVVSLLGKGCFPDDDVLSMGMIGSYGNRCANLAVANADLLIAVGTRLDTRQTGTNLASFVRGGRIVRLDIDQAEIDYHRLKDVLAIVGDAKDFLIELMSMPWGHPREEWLGYLDRIKREYGQDNEITRNIENKRPYEVMDTLNRYATVDQVFTVDIGQNQMFAAQKILIRQGQAWKTSGGLAPMGFALPAAIGAAFASRMKRQIFAITGDGGLHLAAQSLLTIVQYKLPIKIILLNNRSLGMITQFQDLYFDRRKEGTTRESGYLVPDFSYMAQSTGLTYFRFSDSRLSDTELLDQAFRLDGPALIEFDVGDLTVVYPKLEVNMSLEDISPRLPPEELAGLMLFDDAH
ncbi:MAG: thiamine pyrophosphate-binding protein [Clostridia bacterium]